MYQINNNCRGIALIIQHLSSSLHIYKTAVSVENTVQQQIIDDNDMMIINQSDYYSSPDLTQKPSDMDLTMS